MRITGHPSAGRVISPTDRIDTINRIVNEEELQDILAKAQDMIAAAEGRRGSGTDVPPLPGGVAKGPQVGHRTYCFDSIPDNSSLTDTNLVRNECRQRALKQA
jgi:hypothetical protein